MAERCFAQSADHIGHSRCLLDEEKRFGEDSHAGRAERREIGLHDRCFAA